VLFIIKKQFILNSNYEIPLLNSPLEIEDSTIPKFNIIKSYRGWGCVSQIPKI
jgi:hypothetical protein